MIVNKSNLDGIFTTFSAAFNKSLTETTQYYKQLAMESLVTGSTADYKWFSQFPMMREWLGPKVIRQISAYRWQVPNKKYEATIEMSRDDIEEDQLGQYTPQAIQAGISAAEHPDVLLADLLNNGFATVCYDGQYFFDTDHVVNGSNVSNVSAVALSAASRTTADASIGAAIQALQNMGTDEGRKMNLRVDATSAVLVTGPTLEPTAMSLANQDKLIDNSPNPYQNRFKTIMFPGITSTTAWFLFITNRALKPFVYQYAKKPQFVSQTSMENDDVFNRGVFKFGVETKDNMAYALWQLAYGSTGA